MKININGVELEYRIEGDGDIPLIFLNGIGMTMNHWLPVCQNLGPDYCCLLHDCRGQLMSDKPEGDYSLELHTEDLVALMDSLDMTSAHIIGTSYGSEIAMTLAVMYPERCRSLVLIDGVSELDAVLETAVISWRDSAEADPRLFYRTILPWNYSAAYIEENREKLSQREDLMAGLPREFFQGFVRLSDAFLKINLTPRLKEITCPALVIVGEQDIIKPLKFSRIIHENIAGSRLSILPEAGHACVLEKPEEISHLVGGFLSGLGA